MRRAGRASSMATDLIFTRRILPTRPQLPHEKKFVRDASAGRVDRLWKRKTRESVQSDSRPRYQRHPRATSRRHTSREFRFQLFRRRNARREVARRKIRTRISAQTPIRFFNRSLTACGLALPPDAFITWPTNQPTAFGLVLASATLSGFLATMSSTDLLERRERVTCSECDLACRSRTSSTVRTR